MFYIDWFDERLVWDPALYNNTQSVHVYQNSVWKPEIVLANPAKPVALLGHERITTTHYFNGLAYWSVGKVNILIYIHHTRMHARTHTGKQAQAYLRQQLLLLLNKNLKEAVFFFARHYTL